LSDLGFREIDLGAPHRRHLCSDRRRDPHRGIPTTAWDRVALGRHVGYLPQGISLLDGTILDNIARMQEREPLHVIEAATAAGSMI